MASPTQVVAVVSFYMVAALFMVFTNKAVLTSSPSLPLTFLFIQLTIAVLLLHFTSIFSSRIRKQVPSVSALWKETDAKWTALWPVLLINVVGLIFNTLCLRDVEATFFQIARGLVLPLTILISSFHTSSAPSLRVVFCAALVSSGFILGVAPSLDIGSSIAVSKKSLFFGFLSSLFIALHAVLVKESLPAVENSAITLAWWSNIGGALFLFPLIPMTGELGVIMETDWTTGAGINSMFVTGSAMTGFVGFLLCIAGLLSIKVTSPVTHMFSSAARSVLQTLLGVWIFSDILTVARAGSLLVMTGGTM
ncbi:hypothetical protein SISNIDRAFT_473477 [Sistotremastrum niveocremeum HHB9708]|uniref:Sugar phosphate transporter domain-containing protein n=2 Tax=Sistotremastraceae TaxID=3402574 RepID=A0A164XJS5_9AGAM|nr:hypothetical protein SISNIDRAFT_473477 [Sistotremastrum niveocremeum HHB9708]KZT44617.1 hypothetical protein SISSUDRAFT_1068460 [Sistotremastrum suecicum HHB10207 ss-3]